MHTSDFQVKQCIDMGGSSMKQNSKWTVLRKGTSWIHPEKKNILLYFKNLSSWGAENFRACRILNTFLFNLETVVHIFCLKNDLKQFVLFYYELPVM